MSKYQYQKLMISEPSKHEGSEINTISYNPRLRVLQNLCRFSVRRDRKAEIASCFSKRVYMLSDSNDNEDLFIAVQDIGCDWFTSKFYSIEIEDVWTKDSVIFIERIDRFGYLSTLSKYKVTSDEFTIGFVHEVRKFSEKPRFEILDSKGNEVFIVSKTEPSEDPGSLFSKLLSEYKVSNAAGSKTCGLIYESKGSYDVSIFEDLSTRCKASILSLIFVLVLALAWI